MAPIPPRIATAAELNLLIQDGSVTLVALGVEGDPKHVGEVGLANCSRLTPLKPEDSYASFAQNIEISCFTIQLHQGTYSHQNHQESLRYGNQINTAQDDLEPMIHSRLQAFSSQCIVLVVFAGYAELKWAATACQTLFQTLSAYVDAQDLAGNVSNLPKPGLRQSLKSLDITRDIPKHKALHRVGNDAVYTLALLAALLSRPLDAPTLVVAKKPSLFTGRPLKADYPFTAHIRTADRSPLPPELDRARKIFWYFSSFAPTAAGTGLTKRPNNAQLAWSWISFSTKDHLDAFVSTTNSMVFSNNKTVIAETRYQPGVTLTWAERKAKQLEDGDRIREEHRKKRLLMEETMYPC
jgi:hypothetical protein